MGMGRDLETENYGVDSRECLPAVFPTPLIPVSATTDHNCRPEGRDNARTNGNVGHEATIHHINVHPIGTSLQDIAHLLA